jgi:SAM-dependent methyltransferase
MYTKRDEAAMQQRYIQRFQQFGYSPKTLSWDKGKQDVRFSVLTSQYDFAGKSVLDIGCGFGDINTVLTSLYGTNYTYHGIDLVADLVNEGRKHFNAPHITFEVGNFLTHPAIEKYDYIVASGTFNLKLKDLDGYDFITMCMDKAFGLANDGIAFDFLSDKVDYQLADTFHSAPERILQMAYARTRNVVLRNDYMPFEFATFMFKDDSFAREDTLFQRYKKIHKKV